MRSGKDWPRDPGPFFRLLLGLGAHEESKSYLHSRLGDHDLGDSVIFHKSPKDTKARQSHSQERVHLSFALANGRGQQPSSIWPTTYFRF